MGCRCAGIDWASGTHDVLVAEQDGDEVLAGTFVHDEKGLSALCRTLVRLDVELVAIERPDGLLVERLLDAGLRVLPLHPNKVAAARHRFRVSGGKSDRFDAFVLCELARTDHHRFRVLEPDCDQTKAIRAITRAREDLVETRTGVMNQLRAELDRFWPGPLRLFSHLDAEILLAFLERYPSPADAHGLGVARMQAFLVRERYTGGQHPTALMAKLRSAPHGRVGEHELAARRQLVLSYVAMIRTLNAQIKSLERDIRTRMRAHPDGRIFLSMFRSPSSVITAAELLSGDRRLPRALPHPRPTRRRRRTGRGRDRVRQMEDRRLPQSVQQAATRRVLPPRGQQPPLAPLGPDPLRPSPTARPRTPPRDQSSWSRLVSRRVAMLAQPHHLRPSTTPGAAAPHHCEHPDAVRPNRRRRGHHAPGRTRSVATRSRYPRSGYLTNPFPFERQEVDTGRLWRLVDCPSWWALTRELVRRWLLLGSRDRPDVSRHIVPGIIWHVPEFHQLG